MANSIGFVVALVRQVTEPTVPAAAWLNVALFLIFAVLFGYLQFAHGPAAGSTARPAV